jgi:hypothetical protein
MEHTQEHNKHTHQQNEPWLPCPPAALPSPYMGRSAALTQVVRVCGAAAGSLVWDTKQPSKKRDMGGAVAFGVSHLIE